MYNTSYPRTPATRKNWPRFPMSAAMLETPSIIGSFRGPAPEQKRQNYEPPAKQFVMSMPSNTFDESMVSCNVASTQHIQSALNRTQGFNTSFLNSSFTSNYHYSSVNRNHPSEPLRSINLNTTKNGGGTTDSQPVEGIPSIHRSHVSSDTNSNKMNHSFFVNSSIIKRKYPSPTIKSVNAVNALSKGLASTSSSSDGVALNKSEPKTSLRIISGRIEHIQKVIREQPKHPMLLETVANVVIVKPGTRATEKIILLRHHNQGPVLQGIFYEMDVQLPAFESGDIVRCIGRLQPVGNRFQILKITRVSTSYDRAILRLQTVSAFTTKVNR